MELSQLSIENRSVSYYLDLAYQGSLQKSILILKDEDARRLRLRILLLEDKNKGLYEQLAIENGRIDVLEYDRANLQKLLVRFEADLLGRDDEVRKQAREVNDLKAELDALNGSSIDSAKYLTEKLSLMRELSMLRSELECLRAQEAYQQSVLTDKLALQRQVNMLEIELEAQKRTSRRVVNRDPGDGEDRREVDGLRKELAREKREREKAEKKLEKESIEWKTSKTMFESRIEQLQTKLQGTNDKPKEFQIGLLQAEVAVKELDEADSGGKPSSRRLGKRNANQMSTNPVIDTPDGVTGRGKRPAAKKGKPDVTTLCEKSMFSITPFLNRTINMTETPPQKQSLDVGNEQGMGGDDGLNARVRKQCGTEMVLQKDRSSAALLTARHTNIIEKKHVQADGGVINVKMPSRILQDVGTLEKVIEENFEQNQVPVDVRGKSSSQAYAAVSEKPKTIRKKIKLLGRAKTVFEEDGLGNKRTSKISLGSPGPAFGDVEVFFSPLKKDKRGMQASFLA